MRILIATGIFPPDIGGPATYSKIIAEEFSKRGHEVVVVTYGDDVSRISHLVSGENTKIQDTKYKIRFVSRILPKGIKHLIYFWQVLKNGAHADIIYAQDAVSAGFPAVLAALLLRKKFFLKIVGDHAWEQSRQRFGVEDSLDEFLTKSYGIRTGFLRVIQKYTARRAKRIIVPSAYLQSVVEQWGISAERITVIPNTVSLPGVIPAKEEARRILGLDGFLLVTAGRLVPWKGFRMLVELMPQLVAKIQNANLIIVGDGLEKSYLVSRISYLGLEKYVFFMGSVSKDMLVQYLVAADVFLLNTGYEGFSHQLIEAMALGVPIITTDAGGNKEIVENEKNSLVARYNNIEDWKEKVLRLYIDQELRQKLSQGNTGIIERYSVERMITSTESIILNS